MALINCSKCGKQVSDKANRCPNCNSELKVKDGNEEKNESKRMKKNKRIMFIAVFIILLIVGSVYGISSYNRYTDAYSKCEEICKELEEKNYNEALEGLNDLSQSYFEQCGSSIVEKYREIVRLNKVQTKTTDNDMGTYLGMEDSEFSKWFEIKNIGYKLEALGAENIDDYILYAEGVENLKKYSVYDEIIKYTNSIRYETLFESIFGADLNERSAYNINAKLNAYDYSGLNINNKYCKKLYDLLQDYNDGIIDYYNGYFAGQGERVAERGVNKIETTLLEFEEFILDIAEVQIDLINDINSLPEI